MPARTWATCYTDASLSKKGGAWAFWLRFREGRVVRTGACPRYVRNSNEAELAAIFAAIHVATTTWSGRLSGILVCSDCRFALGVLDGTMPLKKRYGSAVQRLVEKTRAALERENIALRTRWVPGHRDPATGTAAFLNDACDRLAARRRKRARSSSSSPP
jgi:ribonuclease HI